MLLAIRTTRGIQAESDENASGSSAAPANDGASPCAPGPPAPPPKRRWSAVLLLGQDADRQVEPAEQVLERRRRGARPSARGCSAAGRPARSGRGAPGARISSMSDSAVDRRSAARRRTTASRPAIASAVAGALGQRPVVDQLAQRSERRVLVGDPGQEQLLEPMVGGLGLGPRPGNSWPKRSSSRRGRPGRAARSRSARAAAMAPGRSPLLVAGDEDVADLVEQAEGRDLAGADRRRARRLGRAFIRAARRRIPARSATIRSPRLPISERSTPYRSRGSRRTWKSRITRASYGPDRPARARVRRWSPRSGRALATCSMARRSSSRPDGSKS